MLAVWKRESGVLPTGEARAQEPKLTKVSTPIAAVLKNVALFDSPEERSAEGEFFRLRMSFVRSRRVGIVASGSFIRCLMLGVAWAKH